ncbi:hypothetical protein [Bradyrhizobium sp. Ai1a-2]|uniref:hypothetical protein n=1 Tax=Bradyrhizobium sp. Ai1a-2 TaxID=196490 RepID=UPI00041364DA|nr:hypothetical protein [Bradyrhizobium sp. Ai1a-2]
MVVINIDPMPAIRAAKKEAVNANFNAANASHVEQAHMQKRLWAQAQDQRLKPEADLRGITVADLAAIILAKPDTFAERELQRQKIMLQIEAATTPAELDAVNGRTVT